jgi:hypothetical protein
MAAATITSNAFWFRGWLKGASRGAFSEKDSPAFGRAEIYRRMPIAGHAGSFVGAEYRCCRDLPGGHGLSERRTAQ